MADNSQGCWVPVNQCRKRIDGCDYVRGRLSFLYLVNFNHLFCRSTFYSDYFSPNRSSVRYILRGGRSYSSVSCGAFCVLAGDIASYVDWTRGASLSFKAGDDFVRGSTFYSDYFYQNRNDTKYPYRGGDSSSGVLCGAFFIRAYSVASVTSWVRGAALSFKPYFRQKRIDRRAFTLFYQSQRKDEQNG